MSVKIIRHAFLMVFRNFGAAIRISFPLFFFALVGIMSVLALASVTGSFGPGILLIGIVFFAAHLLATAGAAVGWHRYILLEERKTGWFSSFSQAQIMPYLLKVVLVTIAVMVIAVLATLALTSVLAIAGVVSVYTTFEIMAEKGATDLFLAVLYILIFAIMTFISWIGLRMSIVLPAVAIESDLSIRQAIAATKPYALATLFFTILGWTIPANALLVDYLMSNDTGLLSLSITVIVNWFAMMLGLSILTTLYGVAVEGRSVD